MNNKFQLDVVGKVQRDELSCHNILTFFNIRQSVTIQQRFVNVDVICRIMKLKRVSINFL